MSKKLSVFVVDDHPVIAQGLQMMLEKNPVFEIVGTAQNANSALTGIKKSKPEIIVADISLQEGINGIELIKRIKEKHSKIKILVLSMHDEGIYAERALKAGANGYIKKSEFTDKIIDALSSIAKGEIFLSREMTNNIMHQISMNQPNKNRTGIDKLTEREFDIFEMIGQGQSTKQIAERLELSEKTVLSHKLRIRNKLKLKNSNELINLAVKWFTSQ